MSENASPDYFLGLTARWTAGARAKESLHEKPLFNDPWAAALAGVEGQEWVEHQSGDNGLSISVRTRFFDDFLQRVADQHAIRQIVLMAEGLDTRAFRLTWPEQTHIFGLDQPQVLQYKEQMLTAADAQPTCQSKALAVDLTVPWSESLLKSGFNASQPSVWLLEGFLIYLPNESVTCILDEITNLAMPESWIGFDVVNSAMYTSTWTRDLVRSVTSGGAPWISAMDDPEAFLAARGWQATLTQLGEDGANYGRWPYPAIPRALPDMPRHWLVTAQKNT